MCNYSDYVKSQGEIIGEARGITKGNKNRLLQDVRNLMDSLDLSADMAMQALKVLPEE